MTRLSVVEPRLGPRGPVADAPSAVAVSLVGKLAEALTLVALVTLVPRVLGPADYGLFALALAVVTIGASAAALGGPALLTRFVPAAAAADRQALAYALAARLGRARAAQAAALVLAAIVLAAAAPERFPPVPTLLVGLALALEIFATFAFQLALGLGAARAWSFRFPLQNATLVLAALVLYEVAGLWGAVAAIPVASGVALATGAAVLLPRLERRPRRVAVPPDAIRFGLFQALGGLFVQVVHRGPVVVVVLLSGSETQAGLAALAAGIALAGTYVVWQAFTVDLPRLAAGATANLAGAEASARVLARHAAVVTVPVALVAAAALPWLLPHVVGAEFAAADAALVPALAILPLAPLTALLTQVTALRVRAGARSSAFGIGGVVFLLVALPAVPRWDAAGATAALLAGTAATALAAPFLVADVYGSRLLASLVAGAAAVLAVGWVT